MAYKQRAVYLFVIIVMLRELAMHTVHRDENTVRMRYTSSDGAAYEFDIALHEPESDQVISKGIKQGLFGPKGTYPSVDEFHSICEHTGAQCENGKVLVEVGSAVGMVSLYAATRGMRVYAFDPLPPNVERLKESRRMNSLYNLTIVWGLVGSTSDPAGRWVESEPGNLAATMRGGGRVRARVGVVTIDETVAERGIELLLLTCQGCELDALRGAGRYLAGRSIKRVIWRHHGKERSLAIARLLDGYKFYSLAEARAGGEPQRIGSIVEYLSAALPAGAHPNVLAERK